MAEFAEDVIHDFEPERMVKLAQVANAKFGLHLSPYDTVTQILIAVLKNRGVAVNTSERLDTLLVKLLGRVS
jgi:hypothetical protein